MYLVGLTGGIASGKSTVTQILKESGCAVIDADVIARQVVSVNSNGWRLVRQHFGDDICDLDGNINRAKLGEIIFSDDTQRKKLNAITHPLIRKEILWQILKNLFAGYRYTIIDAPLLIEAKGPATSLISEIVVVYCEKEQQLQRLMARNDLTEDEAQKRISAQIPLETKKRMATNKLCLIDNSGTFGDTRDQAFRLKQYLDSSWRPEINRAVLLLVPMLLFGVLFHQWAAVIS